MSYKVIVATLKPDVTDAVVDAAAAGSPARSCRLMAARFWTASR